MSEQNEQPGWRQQMASLMKEPRVYADPQRTNDHGDIMLTTIGSIDDMEFYGIIPKEGDVIKFWVDDGDGDGNEDPLMFDGVLHYDEVEYCWTARVDFKQAFHASDRT